MTQRRRFTTTAAIALPVAVLASLIAAPAQATAPDPGTIVTVAGGGGFSTALGTTIDQQPIDVAMNASTIFVLDVNQRVIRALNRSTGQESIYAGSGASGIFDGSATSATFNIDVNSKMDLAPNGDLYVIDSYRVRKVDHTTQAVTTVAGSGATTTSGNGGSPLSAGMNPGAVAVGPVSGDLYIFDNSTCTVRRVHSGVISTYAGTGTCVGSASEGAGAQATTVALGFAVSMAFDSSENLYFAQQGSPYRILKIAYSTGTLTRFSITTAWATSLQVEPTGSLVYARDGGLYRVNVTSGSPTGESQIGGSGLNNIPTTAGEGGQVGSADLSGYYAVAEGPDGGIALGSDTLRRVAAVTPAGGGSVVTATATFTRVAGGFPIGDGGPATDATLTPLIGQVAVTPDGDFLLPDTGLGTVRRVDHATGIITTIAGRGAVGQSSGDGGLATDAFLGSAVAAAELPNGDIVISEYARLRIINHTTHVITTLIGDGGYHSSPTGDGGPASAATITSNSHSLAVNSSGDLFFTDGCQIRAIDHATQVVSRVAGSSTCTDGTHPAGNGGLATSATFGYIIAQIAITHDGRLVVSDQNNGQVRLVTVGGNVELLASVGTNIAGAVQDAAGDVFVVDFYAGLAKLDHTNAYASTPLTTTSQGFAGDGGPSTAALTRFPAFAQLDRFGNLYFLDLGNLRERRIERAAAGVPELVTSLNTVAGGINGRVDLSWDAPAWTGRLPITGYTVTTTPSAGSCVVSGTTAACTGLTDGTSYDFAVKAVNAAGASDSAVVTDTPTGPPTAPRSLHATPGLRSLSLTWTAPTSSGGRPITGYVADVWPTADPSAAVACAVVGLTAQCAGLSGGVPYTVIVHAINPSQGPDATAAATPYVRPTAPRSVVAAGKNTSAAISWATPTTALGVTGYRATATASGKPTRTCTTNATGRSCTIGSLINGVHYSVRVVALIGTQEGAASTTSVTPLAPITPTWRVSGRTVTVSFPKAAGSIATYRLFGAGATTKSVSCSRIGTTLPARYGCTITLNRGTNTLTVRGLNSAKVVVAASAARQQKIS